MADVKKKKVPETTESVTLASLGLETFAVIELERSAITGAPYNPRTMSDAEKRKLRTGLRKHGMVAPITWNRRTGNCVGGHMRLEALDILAHTSNYKLHVAAIDVDETREKELNILLNNPAAMGDWLLPELKSVLTVDGLDLDGTGFDRSDLFYLFGDDIWAANDDSPDALEALAKKTRELADNYAALAERIMERSREDYYIVVVFKDAKDREDFLARNGLPSNRYQSGVELAGSRQLQIRRAQTQRQTFQRAPAWRSRAAGAQ